MVLVTVEGIVEFLQNTETTRAKFLLSKWKAGTLMDLPRFVEDKPWYKLRVKSKPILDTYTDDQPSVETETSEDTETNENSSTALVPVTRMVIGDEETFVCDARLLWEKLGVKNHFRSWITRRIEEYNFVENTDFVKVFSNAQNCAGENKGGKPKIDYILTLDVSKELAMVERTPMGRTLRKYFIEVEKKWSRGEVKHPVPANQSYDHSLLLRVVEQNQQLQAAFLENCKNNQVFQLEVLKVLQGLVEPKNHTSVFTSSYATILGYSKMLDFRLDLDTAKKLGRKATRLCGLRNLEVIPVQDERYETVNSYPVEVLKELFSFYTRPN
jgi:phage anti-repressor protein